MYRVNRNENEIIVSGAEGFEKHLAPDEIGLVMRTDVEWPHDEAKQYALDCKHMTDRELVANALGIDAYPE